jgi:hypothetical protein
MAISLALALQSESEIVISRPQVMACAFVIKTIAKPQYISTLFTEPLPANCTPASPTFKPYSPHLVPPRPECHKSRHAFRSVLLCAWAITGSVLAGMGHAGIGLTSWVREAHERLRNGPGVFSDRCHRFSHLIMLRKPQPHSLEIRKAMG